MIHESFGISGFLGRTQSQLECSSRADAKTMQLEEEGTMESKTPGIFRNLEDILHFPHV